jgi:hypothetical protein
MSATATATVRPSRKLLVAAARPRIAAVALPAALAACSLASCGSSTATLNTGPIASAISHSILAQRGITATVQCPPKVARKAAQTFTCTAHLDVGSYPVYVTETNSQGHVSYGNPTPLVVLNIAKVQNAITASILSQRRLRATVACPPQVIQQQGVKFTCTAIVNGKQYPFAVTEVNGSGRVSYTGEKPAVAGHS